MRQDQHRQAAGRAGSGPTAGSIVFNGADLAALSARQRAPQQPGIQLMFQDAFASLDPRMRVSRSCGEPLASRRRYAARGRRRQVLRILDEVGLPGRRRQPLSAGVLRRPAPAARAGQGPDPAPGPDRRGRAGVGPGRVRAGADTQPDAQAAAPVRPELPVHLPRSVGHQVHGGHHRRDVLRQAGRGRPCRGRLHGARSPVHGRPDRRGPRRDRPSAAARSGAGQARGQAPPPAASPPAEPPVWLPVPDQVRCRAATSAPSRSRHCGPHSAGGQLVGLPFPAAADRVRTRPVSVIPKALPSSMVQAAAAPCVH